MRGFAQLAVLLFAFACAAQEPPAAGFDPAAYAARDVHEGVTLAARPYLAAADVEALFGRHSLLAAGIVPVEVLLVNERQESVRVAWEQVVLLSGEAKFERIEPERIAWLVYPAPEMKTQQPWPGKPTKMPPDKKRNQREAVEAALRSQQMRVSVIPAAGRARGFLYFDRGTEPLTLARASLYVPQVVRLPEEQPLLFFEVSLKVYAEH
ncbi:MAG: hypothetical protein HY653_04265 [Acidobacteria bacterium]|nr:hypothetical protein [Acidobacteriota bacterium]